MVSVDDDQVNRDPDLQVYWLGNGLLLGSSTTS